MITADYLGSSLGWFLRPSGALAHEFLATRLGPFMYQNAHGFVASSQIAGRLAVDAAAFGIAWRTTQGAAPE